MMHQIRTSDPDELQRLLERQRSHPPVDGLPSAARILDLPLFIGDAQAAQDLAFINANGITHVISLGTGVISPTQCKVLPVDVLDMDDQLLVIHLNDCIAFLREAMTDRRNVALVHCVFGQSRSASVCVAFLMAERGWTLWEAYDAVQAARPCININPGFLSQLQLLQRMGGDGDIRGATSAHAELRAVLAAQERMQNGTVKLYEISSPPAPSFNCSKCGFFLAAATSVIHGVASSRSRQSCPAIFCEPLKWMGTTQGGNVDFGFEKEGKLACPKCATKIGSWTWIGARCRCGDFVSPAFQLIPSRIRNRR